MKSEKQQVLISKTATALWGFVAIAFAIFASMVENLIEAVNILGSLFYGSILGIFLVALFLKWINGKAVFSAAIISQLMIFALFAVQKEEIGYLYYNLIGCGQVILLAFVLNLFLSEREKT